jgi:hypothetical protein
MSVLIIDRDPKIGGIGMLIISIVKTNIESSSEKNLKHINLKSSFQPAKSFKLKNYSELQKFYIFKIYNKAKKTDLSKLCI